MWNAVVGVAYIYKLHEQHMQRPPSIKLYIECVSAFKLIGSLSSLFMLAECETFLSILSLFYSVCRTRLRATLIHKDRFFESRSLFNYLYLYKFSLESVCKIFLILLLMSIVLQKKYCVEYFKHFRQHLCQNTPHTFRIIIWKVLH